MLAPRITAVAAAVALLVGFAPYLDGPLGAVSLSHFASGQAPAFWVGRAAVVLLVITAAAAFRSLRLAAGLAFLAVCAATAPLVVAALRGAAAVGWVAYVGSPAPPHLPTIDAAPGWGLGALMLLATLTAAVLMLALIRRSHRSGRLRTIVVAFATLLAISAEVVVSVSYRNSSMGSPRRYVDYLPSSTGSNIGALRAWYAVAILALMLVAVLVTYLQRPVSATSPTRSTR